MYPLGTASFSRKKSESFDEWCSKWNGKTILLSQKSPNKLRAFEWLPADVAFVARFHQIVGFQAKSSHIKNCLRRNTTSKLSAITTKTGTRKLAKQKLWKCSTFLAGFFAVIAWLTSSNLILWQCDRRFNLWDRGFINGDLRDLDFVGIRHPYIGSINKIRKLDFFLVQMLEFCKAAFHVITNGIIQ